MKWILAVAACVLLASCSSSSSSSKGCTPGDQKFCGCPGGTQGAQRCNSKGTGYGTCDCSGSDAGTGGHGGDASVDAAGGTAGTDASTGGSGGTSGASGAGGTGATSGAGGASGASGGSGAGGTGGTSGVGGTSGSGGSSGASGTGGADGGTVIVDPQPTSCTGGGVPPVVGGTATCPDDKNLQGCPCPQAGVSAACWPGYRKNRGHGDCADGTTTCTSVGGSLVWGACQGYTGIDPNTYAPLGTTGAAACTCFTHGYWNITNNGPCFACTDSSCTTASGAVSTLKSTSQCPASATTLPSEPWSADTLKVDCTGYFKLCYTLKALSAPNAQPASTDCVMKQVCTEAHYDVANQTQPFPDLPAWITDTSAEQQCAAAFAANGGYAEMSVDGESDECQAVSKVFQTVNYCPLACNGPNPPAMCSQCTNGGGGPF